MEPSFICRRTPSVFQPPVHKPKERTSLPSTEKTLAILLKREAMKDYDEHLIFLTRRHGIVSLASFGSRSPKSLRGKLLSQTHLLDLEIEGPPHRRRMRDLHVVRRNEFLGDLNAFYIYLDALKWVMRLMPPNASEKHLFDLFERITFPGFFLPAGEVERQIIYLSMLRILGVFPYFNGCSVCGRECSATYSFSPSERMYIGNRCHPGPKRTLELNSKTIDCLNRFYTTFVLTRPFFQSQRVTFCRNIAPGYLTQVGGLTLSLLESF